MNRSKFIILPGRPHSKYGVGMSFKLNKRKSPDRFIPVYLFEQVEIVNAYGDLWVAIPKGNFISGNPSKCYFSISDDILDSHYEPI